MTILKGQDILVGYILHVNVYINNTILLLTIKPNIIRHTKKVLLTTNKVFFFDWFLIY